MSSGWLIEGFVESLKKTPHSLALEIDGETFTYDALAKRAALCASALGPGLTGILADKNVTAYAGILGALSVGGGYVPLSRFYPVARTAKMIRLSGVSSLIVGEEWRESLPALLDQLAEGLTWIFPDGEPPHALFAAHPKHRAIGPSGLHGEKSLGMPGGNPEGALAYVLFTSGSTGEPKGIWVTQANVIAYVDFAVREYGFSKADRFSQVFDLTFDPSVHDLFVSWAVGASLHSFPMRYKMAHARFINEKKITCWYSVPSIIVGLMRLGMLKPAALPSLRVSAFVGEAMHVEWLDAWQKSAPASRVDNVYGPTETTVTVSRYTWNRESSIEESTGGIVPIGRVHETQKWRIEGGELWISGSQVTLGYRNDPQKNSEQFVTKDGAVWYRTGDLVREGKNGTLHFLGRGDLQLKVRGFRIELAEVDRAVQRVTGAVQAVTIGWPVSHGSAGALYTFVCGESRLTAETEVRRACAETIPEYMLPKRVFFLDALPLNANGKVDRHKLAEMVEGHDGK